MREKYQQKYRSDTTRLKHWDYGAMAAYFVTICTKDREPYFGEIVDGEMQCSELGNIVKTQWLKTLSIRPDMNLKLGEFVVMPDHFHGMVMIGENEFNPLKSKCRVYLNQTNKYQTKIWLMMVFKPSRIQGTNLVPNQKTWHQSFAGLNQRSQHMQD